MNVQGCASTDQLVENYSKWPRSILIICQGKLLEGLFKVIKRFKGVDYGVIVYCMNQEKYEKRMEEM